MAEPDYPRMSSVLIRNGHLLDLTLPFEASDVLIGDGRIVAIGRNIGAATDVVIDATGKVVVPGLINAHTHSGQILDRGYADNCSLDLWLMHGMAGRRELSEEEIYTLTAWSVLVQLRTGCTACLDHVNTGFDRFQDSAAAVMQAYVDSGFRAGVAPSMVDLDFFAAMPVHVLDEPPPALNRPLMTAENLLDSARGFLTAWKGRCSRVQPYLGPGAPQRCSDSLLDGLFALSDAYDTGIHTHLLEARSQWFACQQRFGASPVAFLRDHGWLSPRLSCAHGVWLSEDDAEMLAASGAAVSHNPVSNLRLGSGIFNLSMALSKGMPVALGADGAASNDNQNMWEVVKLAALLPSVYGDQEQWVDACEALRLCWAGGAHVLRQEIGAIRPGYQADLVILGGSELFLRAKAQMIPSLVYGELGQSVETVMVAGEILMQDRRFLRIDEERLHDQAAAIVAKGVEAMPGREAAFRERRDYLDRMLKACDCLEGPPIRTAHLS
jgi:5-methylthioadenosine/S-adenosylhomocysteine deaminase